MIFVCVEVRVLINFIFWKDEKMIFFVCIELRVLKNK